MSGEYTAMTLIHSSSPTLVPRVIAWGTYEKLDNVHFLLCEFRNMTDTLPDPKSLTALLADFHRKITSPNGCFGFDMTTFHGNVPIEHGWSDTWEEYFTRTTRDLLQREQEAQGSNQEIVDLMVPFFDKVIPRLLRPMETDGRSLQPNLIHGDLWHGNVAVDKDTGEPIIFDAASFYAHRECRKLSMRR